jgi:NADH:ubiquinone oxidoreductase subunit H
VRRFFWLASAWLLVACGPYDRGPNLIEVKEIGPRHLEVGDRVRLSGSGFPEGRPVTVTFRGDVRRAGDAPREDVTLKTAAELVAPHALEFRVTSEFAAKVAGAPDARHATFRGDVEVAFSPQRASGTSVVGRLDGVVLDVTPDAASDAADSLSADGRRFAAFSGLELGAREDGLVVSEVAPKSRGARAGLTPGDVIVELDGIVVRGVADWIPPPNARSSELSVRRGPDTLNLHLDTNGFSYSAPESLLPGLIALGVLLGSALVWSSPFGRALALLERRVRERVRERSSALPLHSVRISRGRAVLRGLVEALPNSFLPYLLLLAQAALFGLMGLGVGIVAIDLDLLVIPAASLSALLAIALVTGGSERRWSLRQGLRRAGALLLLNVPFIALLIGALLWAGSLRPADVVGLQGAWPWQWAALRNPALGVLASLSVLSLVPAPMEMKVLSLPTRSVRRRSIQLVWWIHAVTVTAFVGLVALGGFQSPLAGSEPWLRALGACCLLGKAWLLIGVVVALRWLLGPIDALSVRRLALFGVLAPSLLALTLQVTLSRVASGPVLGTLQAALPPVACGVALTLVALGIYRAIVALRLPAAELGVQPWL